jgi:hypothetical protein
MNDDDLSLAAPMKSFHGVMELPREQLSFLES